MIMKRSINARHQITCSGLKKKGSSSDVGLPERASSDQALTELAALEVNALSTTKFIVQSKQIDDDL